MADSATLDAVNVDKDAGDFSYPEAYSFDAGTGLTEDTIDYMVDYSRRSFGPQDKKKEDKILEIQKCSNDHAR